MLPFGCCFKTIAMKLQLPIQEQGYSPEKSQLVVGISLHAPIRRQQRACSSTTSGGTSSGAVPPHQEERHLVQFHRRRRRNAVGAEMTAIKLSARRMNCLSE